MATTIEISEGMNEVIEEVIAIVDDEIGIRLNKKTLVPLVFQDPREITDIVIREIRHRVEKNHPIRM